MAEGYSGKLIVLDGADGSGKATQTTLLLDRFKREGVPVETLDFPQYSTNLTGALIRECLDGKRGDFMKLDPRVASLLYAVDRFESRDVLLSWLKEGKTVILDRYVSSNMLHQGAKLGTSEDSADFFAWLDALEYGVFALPRPHLIVYLDVTYELRRALMSADGMRQFMDVSELDASHQRATEVLATQILGGVRNWVRIQCVKNGALRKKLEVHEDIYDAIKNHLPL